MLTGSSPALAIESLKSLVSTLTGDFSHNIQTGGGRELDLSRVRAAQGTPMLQHDRLLSIRNLFTISPRLSVEEQFHTVLWALESVPISTSLLPTLRMRSMSSLGRLGTLQSRYKLTRNVNLSLILVWQTIMSFEQNCGTFQVFKPAVTRAVLPSSSVKTLKTSLGTSNNELDLVTVWGSVINMTLMPCLNTFLFSTSKNRFTWAWCERLRLLWTQRMVLVTQEASSLVGVELVLGRFREEVCWRRASELTLVTSVTPSLWFETLGQVSPPDLVSSLGFGVVRLVVESELETSNTIVTDRMCSVERFHSESETRGDWPWTCTQCGES